MESQQAKAKATRLATGARVATVMVSVVLLLMCATDAASAWSFANRQIADQARSVATGTTYGQCRVYAGDMVNAVLKSNGIASRVGGYGSTGGAYYGAYQAAGAALVGANDALPGDLIQTIQTAYKNSDSPPSTGLHTALVVANTGTAGSYIVRDANWNLDEKVTEHQWNPLSWAAAKKADVGVYVWRFGQAAGVAGPPVAVARNQDGRLELFGVGTANDLYRRSQNTPGGQWSGWAKMDGGISSVAAETNADGRIELFGVGTANDLYRRSQNTPGGQWSAWTKMDGGIRS